MLPRMLGRLTRLSPTAWLLRSSEKPIITCLLTQTPIRTMSSMSGVCFSPFPRNELEIVGFNLRQQLKRRQEEVAKQTDGIISDANTGKGSKPVTLLQRKLLLSRFSVSQHSDIHCACYWPLAVQRHLFLRDPRALCTEYTVSEKDARAVLEGRLKRPVSEKEARTCYERCLKAFDPLAYSKHTAELRTRLDTAIEAARATLRQQIQDASARGQRLTLTRNGCGLLLEPHLGRFPDANEVEELWTLQYLYPLVTWEEGGEFSRDARDAAAANAFGQSGNDCL